MDVCTSLVTLLILLMAALAMAQEDTEQEAERLEVEAQQLLDSGHYRDGINKANRSLASRKKMLGNEHPEVAASLQILGALYQLNGNYEAAETASQRALAIREKALGSEHPDTARSLTNLANLYVFTGAYAKAESLYKRALAANESALGPEHMETSRSLVGLASLYARTGAYQRAEPLYERALAIRERRLGPNHVRVAFVLGAFGAMYEEMGVHIKAQRLYRRALAIREKQQGKDHPETARLLSSLASICSATGESVEAEALYQRALAVMEKTIGLEHPGVASVLQGLGDLYMSTGSYSRAEALFRRAIAIHEGVRAIAVHRGGLGAQQPQIAKALRSLAVLHWRRGHSNLALPLLQRAQRIQSNSSAQFLSAASEARKQQYVRTLTEDAFLDVSLAVSVPGTAAAQLGLARVLEHKGRVLDAVSDNIARLRRSVMPADRAVLDQLAGVAGQLSALTYGYNGYTSPEQYRLRLLLLSARKERLEAELATRSQVFSRELAPVTLANVKRAIPVDAALIELFRYAPIDSRHRSSQMHRPASRYVAYVLKHQGEPTATDLGEAAVIDAAGLRLRAALANPARGDAKQQARVLSDKLLAPLRVHLRGVKHILFSPDGELNLVPMAALLDESDAYLAEHFNVSYLTSGRDLLRVTADSKPQTNGVVMADPDYGRPGVGAVLERPSSQPKRFLGHSGLVFRSLPGTALEAQDLRGLLDLGVPNLLLRRDATEAKLKGLKSPRILHIASHGFFLSDQQMSDEMSKRHGMSLAPFMPSENLLLRSGIALAGANERSSGDDDGILTGLEASQLDLHGTELVVLSACDSAVGEVQHGEGVYGLRRAFALAGAQTQVTSLWKVSDEATRYLMVDYYKRLLQGEGRAAALRSTQRAMIASSKYSHPYYWASFIPIGNWNPLPKVAAKQGAAN